MRAVKLSACSSTTPAKHARVVQTHAIAARSYSSIAAASQPNVLSLIPWAIQNNIQFAKIKPVLLNGSDRGVVATFDIDSNECICSVPAKAALRTYEGCKPVLAVPGDVWRQLPWFAQLALILLEEKVQARSSRFADYLAVLPREVDVPVLWSDSELQQLRCAYFIEQVQQQKQEWAALARQLDRYLAAAGITEQQLFWALSIARSRAFAAPYAAAPLSTAPKLFGAAQVVAAAAWLAQGAGGAWAAELLGAAAAAALGFTLLQQRETQQQHVMCPLLDMFNHDGQEQSECELDVWSDTFRVVASRQWRQGQQVFISYGQSSSDVLLQLYGFVEPNNVHERYLVRALPGALLKHGSATSQRHSSSLAEVAFSRQGIPAIAVAALEQACNGSGASHSTLGNPGILPYAALSSAAKAVCAAAMNAELQQLHMAGADDQETLQAFQQLPEKQQELQAVQQLLVNRQSQLKQLQQQQAELAWQEHQHQEQEAGLKLQEAAEAAASAGGDDATGGQAVGNKMAELIRLSADVELEVQQLHTRAEQLEQLLVDWQARTRDSKQLAVQFRYEKQQLLLSILAQLQ